MKKSKKVTVKPSSASKSKKTKITRRGFAEAWKKTLTFLESGCILCIKSGDANYSLAGALMLAKLSCWQASEKGEMVQSPIPEETWKKIRPRARELGLAPEDLMLAIVAKDTVISGNFRSDD